MNLVLIYPEEIIQDGSSYRVTICGARAARLIRDHGLPSGEVELKVRAGIKNGALGHITLHSISKEQILGTFVGDQSSPELLHLDLIVGISRPPTIRKVIQIGATFGVRSLNLFCSERSEKSYLSSHILREEDLSYEIELALQQAIATIPLKVTIAQSLSSALTIVGTDPGLCIFGDSAGGPIPQSSPATRPSSAVIAIGPEAGFSDRERNSLYLRGFVGVTLGARSVRVEHACAALIGIANMLIGPQENA